MSLSNIKDFSECSFLEGVTLPEGFPSPSSTDQKIMRLSKVRDVFTPSEGKAFLETIRESEYFEPLAEYNGGRRVFYIAPTVFYFQVTFYDGKMRDDSISSRIFQDQPPVIKSYLKIAIERLASELEWRSTTRHLACNAIDYHFIKDSGEPLLWHSDRLSDEQAQHSFVVLLSDPNDNETGWTGGDLLYTAARVFELYKLEPEQRKKISDLREATKGAALNDPAYPTWKITPSQNDGILFGNRGMQHKVTAMNPLQSRGNRMIVTIFDFGPPSE